MCIDAYIYLVTEEASKEDTKAACYVSFFFYTKMVASGFETVTKWIKVMEPNC